MTLIKQLILPKPNERQSVVLQSVRIGGIGVPNGQFIHFPLRSTHDAS